MQTLQIVISVSGAGRLAVGEDARVQVQVVVGLGLVDVSRTAARHRLELFQLDAELRRERLVEMSSSFAESEARQPL